MMERNEIERNADDVMDALYPDEDTLKHFLRASQHFGLIDHLYEMHKLRDADVYVALVYGGYGSFESYEESIEVREAIAEMQTY